MLNDFLLFALQYITIDKPEFRSNFLVLDWLFYAIVKFSYWHGSLVSDPGLIYSFINRFPRSNFECTKVSSETNRIINKLHLQAPI